MAHRSIIFFSDPAIDTRFVVKLAGASDLEPFHPFHSVFKTNLYSATISDQQYWLYHVTGIPSSGTGTLQAPDVLANLHFLTHLLDAINLLIYVVRTDKPSSNNCRLFHDYLCQQDAPIILVQTTHTPSELSWFDLVLTLDGADPGTDKVNLHKAITKHLNRNPKFIPQIERFESAARGCWKLLRKEASWSPVDFRDALWLTYKDEWLTEKDMDAICERIIEHFGMSSKKQSTIEQVSVRDDTQQRVDAILSAIIAVGNVTPIPFLSVATKSIVNIDETVQVCATTIDLLS
jgi:hypothetical protein